MSSNARAVELRSALYVCRSLFGHSGSLPPSGLFTFTKPQGSGYVSSALKSASVSAFWHERVHRRVLLEVWGSAVMVQSSPAVSAGRGSSS